MTRDSSPDLYKERVEASRQSTLEVSSHGQLSPRARFERLFDEGEFHELGRLAMAAPLPFGAKGLRVPGDGVMTAWGRVHGRTVFAVANVYAYMGGSIGAVYTRKVTELYERAGRVGAPVVTFAESGGARLQEGVDIMEACGWEWGARARYSGVLPQIAAVMGPCIGAAAVTATLSDLVFMMDSGVLALAGPKVVEAATGEKLSYADCGGPEIHARETGLCHFRHDSEETLIESLRDVLAMLPSHNAEDPPSRSSADPASRKTEELARILAEAGSDPFDVRHLLRDVLDDGRFVEVAAEYAPNLVAGFGHLAERAVAIVANQSQVCAGAIDTDACRKGARFLQFANAFAYPLLNFVDVPGALPNVSETRKGLLNALVRLGMEVTNYQGPSLSILVRKCHGGAYMCLHPKSGGGDLVYAYPGTHLGIMSGDALASVLFKERAADMLGRIGCRLDDPLLAAERGYLDDVIDPADTRKILADGLAMLADKRVLGRPPRRSSNAPI